MERNLVLSALGLGLFGWLCSLSQSTRGRERRARIPEKWIWVVAIAVIGGVFAATLPTHGPVFSEGQGFGRGFLVGGLAAMLVAYTLIGLASATLTSFGSAAFVSVPALVGVATLALPLAFGRALLVDLVYGIAIGWLVVSVILQIGMEQKPESSRIRAVLLAGVGFMALCAATITLGEYRFDASLPSGRFSALVLTIAALVPVTLLIGALPANILGGIALKLPGARLVAAMARSVAGASDSEKMSALSRTTVALILFLSSTHLLIDRTIAHPKGFQMILGGVVVGLLVWGLYASQNGSSTANRSAAIGAVFTGFLVSFQLMGGFGFGLFLFGMAAPLLAQAASAYSKPESENSAQVELLAPLLAGIVLLGYRVVEVRYASVLRGARVTEQVALFGFLFGAAFPSLLGSLLSAPAVLSGRISSILRLALCGVLCLAVPALLMVSFGEKLLLSLIPGMALGCYFRVSGATAPSQIEEFLIPCFGLAAALAICQFVNPLLVMPPLERDVRVHVLGIVFGSVAGLAVVSDIVTRIGNRKAIAKAEGDVK